MGGESVISFNRMQLRARRKVCPAVYSDYCRVLLLLRAGRIALCPLVLSSLRSHTAQCDTSIWGSDCTHQRSVSADGTDSLRDPVEGNRSYTEPVLYSYWSSVSLLQVKVDGTRRTAS